jgi:hypothetical protein
MLFKYPLSASQYARFQHANNNTQIQALGKSAGVKITDELIVNGVETMYFTGRCKGVMSLVPCNADGTTRGNIKGWIPHHYECWIKIISKPWYIPYMLLDWGFKEALK